MHESVFSPISEVFVDRKGVWSAAGGTVPLISAASLAAVPTQGANGFFVFDNANPGAGDLYWDATGGSAADATIIAHLTGVTALLNRTSIWFRKPKWFEGEALVSHCTASPGQFRLVGKLATLPRVRVTLIGLCSGRSDFPWLRRRIFRASLWSRIFDIRILLIETQFECTETGSMPRECGRRWPG